MSLLFVDVFFAVKLSVKDCIMPSWLTSTDFVIGAPTGRHFGPEYSRHGLLFFTGAKSVTLSFTADSNQEIFLEQTAS